MIRVNPRLSRVFLATAFATVLCVPAAAFAAPAWLKLGGVDGESTDKGHKGEIEILSWSWGETRAGPDYEWNVEEGVTADPGASGEWIADVERPQEAKRTPPIVPLKRGTVAAAESASEARKLPNVKPMMLVPGAGKPVSLAKPLPRGSVRVKVKSPWLTCRVGARFAELELGGGAETYRLKDAVVTGCGASASADTPPMEEITFNYTKIEF